MTDAVSILQTTCTKLTTKVERLRTQLCAAETELAESETALRVLARLGLSPTVDGTSDDGRGNSQAQVLAILGDNEEASKSPKEAHQALEAMGVTSISPDNVRTILSRCSHPSKNLVTSREGRYWRTVQKTEEEPVAPNGAVPTTPEEAFGAPPRPQPVFDDDLDSEVPF